MNEFIIKIKKAEIMQKPLLGRLMQLYLYELSEFSDGGISENGIYEYEYFDYYWEEDERFPFLYFVDSKIAGFVLVNSHAVENKNRDIKSIAEFFVLPEYRKRNMGKKVAFEIFDMFRGDWRICEMESNLAAQKFWRKVIDEYTKGDFDEVILDNKNWRGPVQTFNNSLKD